MKLKDYQLTSLGRALMMVSVVMSRATRVPEVNFSLSTLPLQPTTYRGPLLAFTITAGRFQQFAKLLVYGSLYYSKQDSVCFKSTTIKQKASKLLQKKEGRIC